MNPDQTSGQPPLLKAESRKMLRQSMKDLQMLQKAPSLPSDSDDKHNMYVSSSGENKGVSGLTNSRPTTNAGLLTRLTQLIWNSGSNLIENNSKEGGVLKQESVVIAEDSKDFDVDKADSHQNEIRRTDGDISFN